MIHLRFSLFSQETYTWITIKEAIFAMTQQYPMQCFLSLFGLENKIASQMPVANKCW